MTLSCTVLSSLFEAFEPFSLDEFSCRLANPSENKTIIQQELIKKLISKKLLKQVDGLYFYTPSEPISFQQENVTPTLFKTPIKPAANKRRRSSKFVSPFVTPYTKRESSSNPSSLSCSSGIFKEPELPGDERVNKLKIELNGLKDLNRKLRMLKTHSEKNELETLQRLSAKWQEAAKEALVMLRELIGETFIKTEQQPQQYRQQDDFETGWDSRREGKEFWNIFTNEESEMDMKIFENGCARNQEDANNEGRYRTSTLKEICHQLHIDPSVIGVYNEEEDTFN